MTRKLEDPPISLFVDDHSMPIKAEDLFRKLDETKMISKQDFDTTNKHDQNYNGFIYKPLKKSPFVG